MVGAAGLLGLDALGDLLAFGFAGSGSCCRLDEILAQQFALELLSPFLDFFVVAAAGLIAAAVAFDDVVDRVFDGFLDSSGVVGMIFAGLLGGAGDFFDELLLSSALGLLGFHSLGYLPGLLLARFGLRPKARRRLQQAQGGQGQRDGAGGLHE